MTITVRASEMPTTDGALTEAVKVEEFDGSGKSAPVEKSTEQNESPESDTEETDAKDLTEESEGEGSEEELESKADGDKPRKKGGFQRRIDKLNSRVTERERELEYWKSQALKGTGEQKSEPKVDLNPATVVGKPNPETFDTHAEYVEALTDWKLEQRENEQSQKRQKEALQTEQEKLVKSHTDRVETFKAKHEDFMERLEDVADVPMSITLQELIIGSEVGPSLMYELAKNREEFERIAKLPPLAAAREMGKLEARVSSGASLEKKTDSKRVTEAPRPLDPVGKGTAGRVAKSIDDPNLSQYEYERIRREQMKRRNA